LAVFKQAQKAASNERLANSFEVIAHEWFIRWKGDKAEDSVKRAQSALQKDIIPYIGRKPISDIKTPDVLAVLKRIEDRGRVSLARKTKAVISVVFRHAVQTGRAEYNACDNLRGALMPVKVKR